MKEEVCNKKNCTGCALCTIVCPASCIEMRESYDGFCYPAIDSSKCIDCNLCSRECPSLHNIEAKLSSLPISYYGFSTDQDVYLQSTSGGAATSLASGFNMHDGVVFSLKDIPGARPQLACSASKDQTIRDFIGVKYFQYNLTKEDIDLVCASTVAKKTLFIGLPCQVFSIKQAVKKKGNIDNFFCIDLICQGAPSYMVVKKYRNEDAAARGAKIVRHAFRTKLDQKEPYTSLTAYEDGNEVITSRRDSEFYRAFTTNLFLRESCYECPFAKDRRAGDITLGDFRPEGLQPDATQAQRQNSLVLINNERGAVLANMFNDFSIASCRRDDAVKSNLPLRASVKRPALRSFSYSLLKKRTLKTTLRICDIKGTVKKPLYKIMRLLGK